jgi:hypothetical protein
MYNGLDENSYFQFYHFCNGYIPTIKNVIKSANPPLKIVMQDLKKSKFAISFEAIKCSENIRPLYTGVETLVIPDLLPLLPMSSLLHIAQMLKLNLDVNDSEVDEYLRNWCYSGNDSKEALDIPIKFDQQTLAIYLRKCFEMEDWLGTTGLQGRGDIDPPVIAPNKQPVFILYELSQTTYDGNNILATNINLTRYRNGFIEAKQVFENDGSSRLISEYFRIGEYDCHIDYENGYMLSKKEGFDWRFSFTTQYYSNEMGEGKLSVGQAKLEERKKLGYDNCESQIKEVENHRNNMAELAAKCVIKESNIPLAKIILQYL